MKKQKARKGFTLIMIKPDALEKGAVEALRQELAQERLQIIKQKDVFMSAEGIQKFYRWPVIFDLPKLKAYLCNAPLPIWLIVGEDAMEKVLKIKAKIRKQFGTDEYRLLIHSPSSEEELQWEYQMIFPEDPLIIKEHNNKGTPMKTNNQVEVILFKESSPKEILFLVLKRIPEKGGFWQPITGNVREEETFEEAARREVKEETGISEGKLIDTGYSFDYFDEGNWWHEKVFGMEVEKQTPIILSREHTESKWVTKDEALNKYLCWPGNKEGLKKLWEILEKKREEQ